MINAKEQVMYNEDMKDAFLKTIKTTTRQSYSRILLITEKYEFALGKDLNTFTLEEMETVLHSFNAKSRNTIESYARIISSYLNWSVENNLIKENVLRDFKPKDFEKFIKDELNYISESELRRIEDRCENYQDAIVIRLLFIGVGSKGASEISNLKKEDVDFESKQLKLTNTLKVGKDGMPDKYTTRYMTVDDRTLHIIEGAMEQKTYMKKNGEIAPTENNNVRPYTDLVDNDYVVRASITRTENWNEPVDKFVLYRRLDTITDSLGLEEKLSAKYLQRSGMLYYASQIIGDKEVTLDDIKIVADRFNLKSYHNLKGFITTENIRRLYPIK